MPRGLHKLLVLLVGDFILIDVVGVENHVVRFLILMVVASHDELAAGDEDHVLRVCSKGRSGDEE